MASLPQNLKHIGKEAAEDIQDKFSALDDDINSREESLIDSLAQQYMATLEEVDERIEEMKTANKGLIDAALGIINGVIETILKLKEMIVNLFSSIQGVIGIIMEDPIGFMKKLFDGIGKGIDAFKANIQKHMMGGLIAWLTGSLGPMGINIPDDIFSLKGIFSLVMQVLGLGWSYIRKKAVMMMGERMVNALTKGYKMFTTFATKGLMGIWEYLKGQFTDLKETVIDAIKGLLITKVIKAGIKWLMSLLIPGAGFIKAIMAIKDLIVFFVESAMMLIPAITEAILALAVGSIAGVAKAIEKGLAGLIAMVINLFAKLIGLGGLSKKVMAIFKKIRKRVDRAVMKLLLKAKKAGRKLMAKLGIKKKPSNPKEHKAQVDAGLTYLHQQETVQDKDGNKALTQGEANKVAAKTKKKFAVFTSITPKDVGGKWVYHWKGSDGKEVGAKVEGESEGGQRIAPYTITPLFNVYLGNPSEFKKQLKRQEAGINKMRVEKWIQNRDKFAQNGRGKDDLKDLRDRMRRDIAQAYIRKNLNRLSVNFTRQKLELEAEAHAKKILTRNHAILHNPDQVAGGEAMVGQLYNDGDITDETSLKASKLVGDRGTNSSLGAQWGANQHERVIGLYSHVKQEFNMLDTNKKKTVFMNVKLKYK